MCRPKLRYCIAQCRWVGRRWGLMLGMWCLKGWVTVLNSVLLEEENSQYHPTTYIQNTYTLQDNVQDFKKWCRPSFNRATLILRQEDIVKKGKGQNVDFFSIFLHNAKSGENGYKSLKWTGLIDGKLNLCTFNRGKLNEIEIHADEKTFSLMNWPRYFS